MNFANPRALVVGKGFVGQNARVALETAGFSVDLVGRKEISERLLLYQKSADHRLFAKGPYSVWIYASGSVNIAKAEKNPLNDLLEHQYSFNAAKSLFLLNKADKSLAILVSSGGTVYGERTEACTGLGFRESSLCMPISAYGIRNKRIEDLFINTMPETVECCIFRMGNPFHLSQYWSQRPGLLMSIFISAYSDTELTLRSGGVSIRNYFPIDLVESSIKMIITRSCSNLFIPQIINIGSDFNATSLECIDIVESITGKALSVSLCADHPEYEIKDATLDCALLDNLLDQSQIASPHLNKKNEIIEYLKKINEYLRS